MSGERHVETREIRFHALDLAAARHLRQAHQRGTVFESDCGVADGGFVGVVPARFKDDGLGTEILERLAERVVLLDGSLVHGTGLGIERRCSFDARRRLEQHRRAELPGRRRDQPWAESEFVLCGHRAW